MDNGSWLWKKKPVEKTILANDKTCFSLKGNQQEMLQSAALERSVKNLNEKLASLIRECNAKDELVASLSKSTQEAIAGREIAEAKVILLNTALKDCTPQLSSPREEHEEKVREAIMKISKELEKEHKKLEDKLLETSRKAANLAYENSQLTNALLVKERLIENVSEQMSQATGEFKILMDRLDSTEKENAFLKYEFQMLEKEVEIRNNEIKFTRQSAEVSEKKLMQSGKKISKLEAECQRLRILVRKLPGPTAFAKIKSEVEMQVRDDQMEMRRKPCEVPDERIGLVIERLCELEEENKILKEIVLSKDDELRSLRTTFSLLASKLSQVEDQLGDLSKSQESMELIDDSRSWASALRHLENFKQVHLENFKQVEIDNSSEYKMIGGSEMSLMDDFAEMEKLAIVSVDSKSGNSCDTLGKELMPVTQIDLTNSESKEVSTEKTSDWIQSVLKAILEETRMSKRSVDEILEDIRVALKCMYPSGPTTDAETLKPVPVSGYITWDSSNGMDVENQVVLETSVERLQSELESVIESKRLVEEQIDNQKLINEELDAQLSVSRSQLNDLHQKLSSLEVELEDRSHCCEELEATCLELQLQLESVSCKELRKNDEKQGDKFVQTGWEATAASTKLAECRETILNLGKQLKALTPQAAFEKTDEKTLSQQRSSLRDRMLAEDGVETEDPNSPKTKEKIVVASNMQSSRDSGFYEVKTTVPVVMAIVPSKNRGGGSNLVQKLLFRRKKGSSKK